MIRHLPTGQVARAVRSACLPLLCLMLLPTWIVAQNGDDTKTAGSVEPPAPAAVKTSAPEPKGGSAANPAPEPDTILLLGTGAVVLLLLYTRRRVRVRVLTPRTAEQN